MADFELNVDSLIHRLLEGNKLNSFPVHFYTYIFNAMNL